MDTSVIPVGYYCYNKSGNCPYWSSCEDKPIQENGYCAYLGEGDWDSIGLSLLWDQCKECGVNMGEDE